MTATPAKSASPHQRDHQNLDALLLGAAVCVLMICGIITFHSIQRIQRKSDFVAQTHAPLRGIARLESFISDAEQDPESNTGVQVMDEIREHLTSIRYSHDLLLGERAEATDQACSVALMTALVTPVAGLSFLVAAFWTVQNRRKKTEAIRLSEMDQRRKEYLAALAHELRNPLAPIRNAVQLMGMLKLDPEIDQLLQLMARQIERLVGMIDGLLDESRINWDNISLHGEIAELPGIIDTPVEASTTLIAENGQSNFDMFSQTDAVRPLKVLIVEDMRASRVITARLLEKLGHEVETVENGMLALSKLETFTPDVVLSDIAMPVMTGYELARRIRQRSDCSQVCLVALTGFGQTSDREKALEAGFHEHMVKPVDIGVLKSLFEKLAGSAAC